MLLLSPVLLENLTFAGSRTLCDILFVTSFSLVILKNIKIRIDVLGACTSLMFLVVMLHNLLFDYANVSKTINSDMSYYLQWLIEDREIADFVPLGDYYRNSLIYLRYLLIPIYFAIGCIYARKRGRETAIEIIWRMSLIALILNLIVSLFKHDDRISGLFDNTATLSSLAVMCIIMSYFTRSHIKFLVTFVLGLIVLIMSQTVSAFLGLSAALLVIILRIRNPHKKTIFATIILSAVIASVGLIPYVMDSISKYLYTGSLVNRLNIWTTIFSYFDSWNVITFGLGAFPVFADNVFIWMISGFGIATVLFYLYLYKIGNKSHESSLFITMVLWQGMLFPGFIMPYMLITTFIILGVLSTAEEESHGTHIIN